MKLEFLKDGSRLFTYKVVYDSGSAPNPYGGVCSLAICKPKIRSVAKVGDVVVGFGSGKDSCRIVYVMLIDLVLAWNDYIDYCQKTLKIKIPDSAKSPGDCIYQEGRHDALPSLSGHDCYKDDVGNGKNVLLSKQFWYFGCGDNFNIYLRDDLRKIIPNRGHRSNSNNHYKKEFIGWFNDEIKRNHINGTGELGHPKNHTSCGEKCSNCSGC